MSNPSNLLSSTRSPEGALVNSQGRQPLVPSASSRGEPRSGGTPLAAVNRSTRKVTPRGAVLLIVLASLGVLAVVLVSILKLAVAERRAIGAEQWRAQAAWLAESGLERAAVRLEADSGYTGETWTIPPELLDGQYPASVNISVETSAGQPSRRVVRAVADYPSQSQDRVRRSRQVVLDLSQGETQR